MKKIFQLLLLLPIFVFGQNQENGKNSCSANLKNEFGINLYSLTGVQMKHGITGTHSFFNGVYYKHYFNKNGLRTSFDYYQKLNHYETHLGNYDSKSTWTYKAGEIKVGYERLIFTRKFIPFAFADFIYNYSQANGYMTASPGCFSPGYDDLPFLIESSQFFIATGIGLNYRPIKNLVISIESNCQYGYSISQDIKNSIHKNGNTLFKFNPVRRLAVGLIF